MIDRIESFLKVEKYSESNIAAISVFVYQKSVLLMRDVIAEHNLRKAAWLHIILLLILR